jgi:hypothetical protein
VKRVMATAAFVICTVASGVASASASTATTWQLQSVPDVSGNSTLLNAVSCPTRQDCVAVGQSAPVNGDASMLAEKWNGSSWVIQPTPAPAGVVNVSLYGVSCTSAANCTAVGVYNPPKTGGDYALADHWNGTSWTVQHVPALAKGDEGWLYGVSCPSAANCTAAGFYSTSRGPSKPLAEHWNGTKWTAEALPLPATGALAWLAGVSCPTAHDCTAVGSYGVFNQETNVFAEHWNGTKWTARVLPQPAGGTSYLLLGVSCWQSTGCVAVGGDFNGSEVLAPIVDRLNGTSWALQKDAAPADSEMWGVSCQSAQSCTAVGEHDAPGEPPVTAASVAEHWNGTGWTLQTVPAPAKTHGAVLSGVSCLGPVYCTAAGSYNLRGHLALGIPLAAHEQ